MKLFMYLINFFQGSNVRLSQLSNKGFIEIFHGKTWIKVDDKNWDERKQASLCRDLGYNSTKSLNTTHKKGAGEMVAPGGLYCCFTQPSNHSCCSNLHPSNLTQESKIPYTVCMYYFWKFRIA